MLEIRLGRREETDLTRCQIKTTCVEENRVTRLTTSARNVEYTMQHELSSSSISVLESSAVIVAHVQRAASFLRATWGASTSAFAWSTMIWSRSAGSRPIEARLWWIVLLYCKSERQWSVRSAYVPLKFTKAESVTGGVSRRKIMSQPWYPSFIHPPLAATQTARPRQEKCRGCQLATHRHTRGTTRPALVHVHWPRSTDELLALCTSAPAHSMTGRIMIAQARGPLVLPAHR